MKTTVFQFIAITASALLLLSCDKDEKGIEETNSTKQKVTDITGLYLLSEGQMNANDASLTFYDYESGIIRHNIFEAVNPEATKGLGDSGNDILIYGSKMYVVLNGSNKVEVLDVKSAKRVKVIPLKKGRNICASGGKVYVSSHGNEIEGRESSANGTAVEIDTTSLTVTRRVEIGRQPEGIAVANRKVYVANSGGYDPLNYERTVSVINLSSFEKSSIDLDINLGRICVDSKNNSMYVASQGDYRNTLPKLFVINTTTDEVKKSYPIAANDMALAGDTLYIIGTAFNYSDSKTKITYSMLDTKREVLLNNNFITDGTDSKIKMPYGVAVDPCSRNIYLLDAGDFQSNGKMYCFDNKGKKQEEIITGKAPGHIAFIYKPGKAPIQ